MKWIVQFVLKQFAKRSDKKTGVAKLLNETDPIVQSNVRNIEIQLKNLGINPEDLTSTDDVLKALNYHNALMNQHLKQHFKGLGLRKGVDDLAKTKDPFIGWNPRVQQDIDGIIKNLKSMEPMDAMKEANLVIGRKGKYKNLSSDEAQRILKDTDDHIFQRDVKYDEFGDPIKPDPEDLASGGIAGPLHLYEGGRAGFDKGKKVDLGKRAFLKGTGATLGVLSMLPFVGKFFKPVAKTVGKFKGTPNLVVDITQTPNMPNWYIPAIRKVLKQGEDITDKAATAARERVHRDILPDGDQVTVTQNIDNQTISVNVENPNSPYMSGTGAGEQTYTIQYSKGKVIEEGKYKGQKEADTLEVDEPYTAQVGPDTKDVEIEFDVNTYNPKSEVHDTSVLESYATGKKVKSRGTGEVRDPWEGYSPDLKADDYIDDYAKGGRVSLSKGGLAKILGV